MLEVTLAITQILATLAAIAAIVVAARGVRQQLWLHTYATYTERFADISRRIPLQARRDPVRFSLSQVDPIQRDELLNVALLYLNLCSEEFYLARQGMIDDKTWAIWEGEMKAALRRRWMQEAWGELKDEYDSDPEFCRLVNSSVAAG